MIHPSYQELIDDINKVNQELGEQPVLSRYSLVQVVSKRARALVDGELPLVERDPDEKELTTAINEAMSGKIGSYAKEPEAKAKITYDEMAVVDLSADYENDE